jgi:hypothetical protein
MIPCYTVLLFILQFSRLFTVVYNQEIYLEDVRTMFTEDVVKIYCPEDVLHNPNVTLQNDSASLHAKDYEGDGTCSNRVYKNIRTMKLAEYYNRKRGLEDIIDQKLTQMQMFDKKPIVDAFGYYDVSNFHEKLQILQNFADSKAVQKICVVGLNLGYALLNFIASNPTASFLVFDNINDQYQHTPTNFNILSKIAQESLLEMFPDRTITFIGGNTKSSLPNFNKEFSDKMDCNVLYIDGQTQYTNFLGDLRNSLQLLSPTFNRLIIDSVQLANMHSYFNYYARKVNEGIECLPKIQQRQKKTCLQNSLTSNLQSLQANKANAAQLASNAEECSKRCSIQINTVQDLKGFYLTQCVAFYANSTDGLHIEFVFALENCKTVQAPPAEPGIVAEPESDVIYFPNIQMTVVEVKIN